MKLRHVQELAEKLRKEDRENGRGRKWRTNYNKLNAQLLSLENDHHALELVHPQVREVTPAMLQFIGLWSDCMPGQLTDKQRCMRWPCLKWKA